MQVILASPLALECGADRLSRNVVNYQPALLTSEKTGDLVHTASEA